jgi:hypothetical protein
VAKKYHSEMVDIDFHLLSHSTEEGFGRDVTKEEK